MEPTIAAAARAVRQAEDAEAAALLQAAAARAAGNGPIREQWAAQAALAAAEDDAAILAAQDRIRLAEAHQARAQARRAQAEQDFRAAQAGTAAAARMLSDLRRQEANLRQAIPRQAFIVRERTAALAAAAQAAEHRRTALAEAEAVLQGFQDELAMVTSDAG